MATKVQRTAERMRIATADVAAGNPLEKVQFQIGFLCGELDKRDAVIAELRSQLAAMRGDVAGSLAWSEAAKLRGGNG